MKHFLMIAGVIAFASLCAACQKPAPDTAPVTAASTAGACLQYAPGMVTLTGMASTKTISAPGKDSRQALLLSLDAPICIGTHATRAAEYPSVENLRVIELVPQSDFADVYSLAGQRVSVHGGLVPMSGDGVAASTGLVLRTIKPAQ